MSENIECLVECEQIGDGFLSPPSYLFQSQSLMVSFIVIQEEMEQLHEYCLVCQEATDTKINSFHNDLVDYKSGRKGAEDQDIGDITCNVIDGIVNFEIPKWIDTQSFLVKAMCLMLLSCFLERSLKSLSSDLATDGAGPKFAKGVPKTSIYIRYLQENCGLSFDEPDSAKAVLKNCRFLRNDFAHGDWDTVRQHISGQSLREAFDACSVLLREIESAYLALEQT